MDIACFVVSLKQRNNKTSNIHAWRYFETSIASFSELREPFLMILGAKWPQSLALSEQPNTKTRFETQKQLFEKNLQKMVENGEEGQRDQILHPRYIAQMEKSQI